MLAPIADVPVGWFHLCLYFSGFMLISGNGTILSCCTCLSTLSYGCSGKSGATSHSLGFLSDTIAVEQGLSGGCVGSTSRSSVIHFSGLSNCKVFRI